MKLAAFVAAGLLLSVWAGALGSWYGSVTEPIYTQSDRDALNELFRRVEQEI